MLGVMDPIAGALLVAAPDLGDPNFAGSVVLLLDVDEDGVLGIVLNRPTAIQLADVWPQWAGRVADPSYLFHGGPVETDTAMAVSLLTAPGAVAGWRQAYGAIGVLDPELDPDRLGDELRALRVFAGYAGWAAAQLAEEIAEGSWFVVPSRPEDLFRADVETLRRDVLRRQPGDQAWVSTRPANPDLN